VPPPAAQTASLLPVLWISSAMRFRGSPGLHDQREIRRQADRLVIVDDRLIADIPAVVRRDGDDGVRPVVGGVFRIADGGGRVPGRILDGDRDRGFATLAGGQDGLRAGDALGFGECRPAAGKHRPDHAAEASAIAKFDLGGERLGVQFIVRGEGRLQDGIQPAQRLATWGRELDARGLRSPARYRPDACAQNQGAGGPQKCAPIQEIFRFNFGHDVDPAN